MSTKEANTEVIVAKKRKLQLIISLSDRSVDHGGIVSYLYFATGVAQIAVKIRVAAISTFAMLTAID